MSQFDSYILKNHQGDEIHITNFGARITKWLTSVDGQQRNIVLGYERLEDYLQDNSYLGAIVGPIANRIANSHVKIDGNNYQLDNNENGNHLHGGANSIANQFWQLKQQSENKLTLNCTLADNFNGYPGAISISVEYLLTKKGLTIKLTMNSEKTTIVGPTSHPYFNLAGISNNSKGHKLQLLADHYTPMNERNIPNGEVISVKNTRLDFTQAKPLPYIKDGLDDNFLLTPTTDINPIPLLHSILTSPDNKLALRVSSNYPAMQVYTGQHLNPPFAPYDGICLEPQFCPNSPNQENFPFKLLTAGNALKFIINYELN